MLVLSRRPEQEILIPDVGVSMKVLDVRGNTVKVGITAPQDLQIVRGEILPQSTESAGPPTVTRLLSREEFHQLKNRLNTINLAIQLVQQQREAGRRDEAEATFQRLLQQCGGLNDEFTSVTSENLPGRRCRTLLVEDDANERELLASLLRLEGYDVVTVADGLEALDYLRTHDSPEVVLLDMRMPRCNGRETIEAIRTEPKLADLKVFAVSASAPAELGVPTGNDGVNGWFAKPLNAESLIRGIQSLRAVTTSI